MKLKGIKLDPREKIIVALAFLAVIGYVFYSFWFVPYSNKIADIKTEMAKSQTQIAQYKALLGKEKEYSAKKPELLVQAAAVQQSLPAVDAAPAAIQDLRGVLESNGLIIKSLTIDLGSTKKASDPSLDSRTVRVNFIGSFPLAFAAVKSLEGNSQRTYTVSDLSLSKGKDGLTGIITVQIYLSKTAIPGFEYKPMLENKGKVDPFIQ